MKKLFLSVLTIAASSNIGLFCSSEGSESNYEEAIKEAKEFVDKILWLADESGMPHQMEVQGSGGRDGTEIQKIPYPIDWCFIGAPEENVHTPDEKVHKRDIDAMIGMYRYLMEKLWVE